MRTDIPRRYEEAISTLFEIYPMGIYKFFVVRSWITTSPILAPVVPTPCCWMINASSLPDAQNCSRVVRNVIQAAIIDEGNRQLVPKEKNAIADMVSRRVNLLSHEEATRIMYCLGIPIQYHPNFTNVDQILVIPFLEETGFSRPIMDEFIPKTPNKRPRT